MFHLQKNMSVDYPGHSVYNRRMVTVSINLFKKIKPLGKSKENRYAEKLIEKYAGDIISSSGMQSEKNFIQHGGISCYSHSVSVALMSINIAQTLRIHADIKSMIRGALLHDYFLYDWHERDPKHKLHGFTHARTALRNAERDFNLSEIERDIIEKHMFPVNIKPPRHKESYIVTIADKICALREVIAS